MRFSTLSAAALTSGLALAQNGTSNGTCVNRDSIEETETGRINSTGTTSFAFDSAPETKPWYLSVLVNQTGSSTGDNRGTSAWPYLSTPEEERADVCFYSFQVMNKTSTGDNCEGVLSNKCMEFITEAVRNSSSTLGRTTSCNPLPSSTEFKSRQWDACGALRDDGFVRHNVTSNATCAASKLSGVDLPDNYLTSQLGFGLQPFNSTLDATWDGAEDDAYDLLVVQTAVFAVAAATYPDNAVERDAKVVCVSPDNVLSGSRVPENKTPWPESDDDNASGAGLRWSPAVGLSGVVAGVAAFMLLL